MIIETTNGSCLAPRARKPRRHRLLTASSILYLLSIIAVAIALRTIGDRHWIGTVLLLSPRWILALPLLLLIPWALLTKSWRTTALHALSAIALLWTVLGLVISVPRTDDSRADLRLLSCNIHRQHVDAEALSAYLDEVRPDVVALQDWSSTHEDTLFQDGWHTHREDELFVASRFPIISVTPIDFDEDPAIPPGEKGFAAIFTLDTPHGLISLINLHFASPHSGLDSMRTDHGKKLTTNIARREHESIVVRAAAERLTGPLIIAGDFNTVSESPIFREQWSGFSDAYLTRGLGLGFTYLNRTTQIRIDHILAGEQVLIERCWVGPDVSAAHRPLIADITLP